MKKRKNIILDVKDRGFFNDGDIIKVEGRFYKVVDNSYTTLQMVEISHFSAWIRLNWQRIKKIFKR